MAHRDEINSYMRQYQPKWKKKNPEKNLSYQRKYRYGITAEQLVELSKKQDDLCALCNTKSKLDVDHNHKTGKVRGLLCRRCNLLLGLLKENPATATKIARYLSE